MSGSGYRGRFAPSPTGPLHLGSALAAVASWLDARAVGGEWLVRIEDLDPPREQPGADRLILDWLRAVGMRADGDVCYQHGRSALYQRALDQLMADGSAFECRCSRSDLAARGGLHRGACKASAANAHRPPAIRLRVPDREIEFEDRVQGGYRQNLREEVGDFVLRRADGPFAYQLAVVVDDAEQGITDVVRGSDLIDSTPRQIYLQQCLGLSTPRYAHVPVLIGANGQKLSKQNLAPALSPVDFAAHLPQIAGWLGQPAVAGLPLDQALEQLRQRWRMASVPRRMTIPLSPPTDPCG
ncbi:MAG: tRNA glutamyl-Q(34) synthetase GluQRS [Xanthomonadales bacterium]|nr:tRNA glutamyl-Q(34) synthetase GluQRS [Xanthomonadales bacterium]MCB1611353.1 tRNA glutamyl-Q(34) synthetase GluQRS [Xanthomonadales bacterium]